MKALKPSKTDLEYLRRENEKHPQALRAIPVEQWSAIIQGYKDVIAVLRSKRFLVVLRRERPGIVWMSVNRTAMAGTRWVDGITWDELQRLKREAGYGDKDAIEIYPRDRDVVDVANIRHLWILEDALVEFGWRNPN